MIKRIIKNKSKRLNGTPESHPTVWALNFIDRTYHKFCDSHILNIKNLDKKPKNPLDIHLDVFFLSGDKHFLKNTMIRYSRNEFPQ